jgi:hypothetical protein
LAEADNNTVDNNTADQFIYMLTTVDNPYDPFTQWDEWYAWDRDAGYHTPGFLDRIARMSDELSEGDQHLALEQAMDEIVRENVMGVHRKVKRGDVVTTSSA